MSELPSITSGQLGGITTETQHVIHITETPHHIYHKVYTQIDQSYITADHRQTRGISSLDF